MSCLPLRLVCMGHLAEFVIIFVTEHSEPPLMKESGRRGSWKEGRGEGGREGGREWVNRTCIDSWSLSSVLWKTMQNLIKTSQLHSCAYAQGNKN